MGEITLTPFDILFKAIRKELGVSKQEITSRSRYRRVCEARQMFCFLARKHTHESSTNIGKAIKHHHATVLYSANTMRDLCTSTKRLSIAKGYIEKEIATKLHTIIKIEVCNHCNQPIYKSD